MKKNFTLRSNNDSFILNDFLPKNETNVWNWLGMPRHTQPEKPTKLMRYFQKHWWSKNLQCESILAYSLWTRILPDIYF